MDETSRKVSNLLDKLTLESIGLMEQHIRTKLAIEEAMSNGEMQLARSRYIMGQNTVSQLQLPNEESTDIKAQTTVNRKEAENIMDDIFSVDLCVENKETLKWFGVLVPQSLHVAQKAFGSVLQFTVESINIQKKLENVLSSISGLKKILNQ